MDLNKITEYHILYIVTAISALVIAVAVRFLCISGGCDAGTANLVFVIVLGIEAVLYLALMKIIINQMEKFIFRRKAKKEVIQTTSAEDAVVSSEESVHDRIVRERFEQAISAFCEYTQKALGRYIAGEELKKLNTYVELFAREQPLEKIDPVQVSRQLSNNDLYHYGWNLWNHVKGYRQDQRQEAVATWLKAVFANLNEVEFSTIKGKLTIHDSKSKITIQKSIPDYLRFLKG
ncbi:hypothetical protein AGMMS49574_01740 [Bacteroidia bacterium]|nr:hypothetical protein AGMMS49574_01740 [Bacteroidia bacterium]